ncbi:MAG: hypothetical protein H5T76_04935, partial [Streptomyces sp.]|nr:hypothetical protein [Streptomyces sp.]
WGAAAGGLGALLAYASGAAGRRAAPLALGDSGGGGGAYAGRGGDASEGQGEAGPYTPGTPYRPPNPATNPYLRLPEELRGAQDARPPRQREVPGGDVYGAQTMSGPVEPPRRAPRRPATSPEEGPPPPPGTPRG